MKEIIKTILLLILVIVLSVVAHFTVFAKKDCKNYKNTNMAFIPGRCIKYFTN